MNINYSSMMHEELPHVIKFSGGRSSGMMLFSLLKEKQLLPERGDVVVFNNTSAEHPATYDFVARCKEECEKEYGIPFFLTEFQTYEDAVSGIYDRVYSYRLVNSQPKSEKNPHGFQWRGEVFEELISWNGYIPNRFGGRICTTFLKLLVSKQFIEDWLSGKETTERLGHFREGRQVDIRDLVNKHTRSGGKTPEDIYSKKKKFSLDRPFIREAQDLKEFTSVANLYTPQNGIKEYCSLIGLRGDERHRKARMDARRKEEKEGESGSNIFTDENENYYTPLIDAEITKEDVISFWKSQDWDLEFPADKQLSNCVYCFLKGTKNLANLIATDQRKYIPEEKEFQNVENTPSDINWWIDIEKKYGRDLIAEERETSLDLDAGDKAVIGFFGLDLSYEKIKKQAQKDTGRRRKKVANSDIIDDLPCDCTD